MAERISAENFENKVLGSGKIALADFYSDTCVPCKRLSPVLAEVEEKNEDIELYKINVNFDTELAVEYSVSSVPTVVFFKDGKEVQRFTGAVGKDKILDIINEIR